MREYKKILWLDDMRTPLLLGVDVVKSHDEFVAYMEALKPGEFPDMISFDHDLALEHYPFMEEEHFDQIPYHTYKTKTGLACAEYIVNNKLPLKAWTVHSHNELGSQNIREVLMKYRPAGHRPGFRLPYSLKTIDGVASTGYRIRDAGYKADD